MRLEKPVVPLFESAAAGNPSFSGAGDRISTYDPLITNQMLYQLSYASIARGLRQRIRCNRKRLERETGIEPATNSLEGCDSTIELLPP